MAHGRNINDGETRRVCDLEIKFIDHKLAFTEALRRGAFTRATVGDYMYMYTDPIKGDAFKHKWTKEYIFNKKRGPIGPL